MALYTDPLMADLNALTEQFDRAVGRMLAGDQTRSRGWLPAADIFETENEVVIELDVPGLEAENVSAEVVDGQLVVTGERQPSPAQRFFRNERWSGRFVRTFSLPQSFLADGIRADYRNGVLRLSLAKPEETKPKRIQITTEQKAIDAEAK
jgi:HSP20 family protein